MRGICFVFFFQVFGFLIFFFLAFLHNFSHCCALTVTAPLLHSSLMIMVQMEASCYNHDNSWSVNTTFSKPARLQKSSSAAVLNVYCSGFVLHDMVVGTDEVSPPPPHPSLSLSRLHIAISTHPVFFSLGTIPLDAMN